MSLVTHGLDGQVHCDEPHNEAPSDAVLDFSIVASTGVSAAVYLTAAQGLILAAALLAAIANRKTEVSHA